MLILSDHVSIMLGLAYAENQNVPLKTNVQQLKHRLIIILFTLIKTCWISVGVFVARGD